MSTLCALSSALHGVYQMWENDDKRLIIRNIILVVLILAVLIVLGFAMVKASRARSVQTSELSEVSSQKKLEKDASVQEQIDAIQAEYDKDLAVVKEYMPGIVCWGDTLTAGSSGNISFPDELQKYIDNNICRKYDFSTTVNITSVYTSFDWNSFKVNIPVINMGGGDDNVPTILGRSGVSPYVLADDIVIPAETEPVLVKIVSENGVEVSPLSSGDVGINNVFINGVEGVLSVESAYSPYLHASATKYYFTRSESGAEQTAPAGTRIHTSAETLYEDYIHVIWIGTYGGYKNYDELIDQIKLLLARQSCNSDRYIVIGLCTLDQRWTAKNADRLDLVDNAMLQAFGSHFINLRKYLCSDGLADAGLSATKADNRNISVGIVPESLRSASGNCEFSGKTYALIGRLVYDRMDKLGFFDEITAELGIK